MWKVLATKAWIWFDGLHVLGRLAVVAVLVAGLAAVVSAWPDSASDRPVTPLATSHPDQRLIDEAKRYARASSPAHARGSTSPSQRPNIPAALCVTNDGLWYFEVAETGASTGDRCQEDRSATIEEIAGEA